MNAAYLEVTYRQGKPVAAYYYLPRVGDQRSVRTRRVEPGLLIDLRRADVRSALRSRTFGAFDDCV